MKKIIYSISILSLILAPSLASAQYYYPYNNYNPNYSSQVSAIQAQINALYQQIAQLNNSNYNYGYNYPYNYNTYQSYTYPYNYNYTGQVLGATYPYQTTCNFTQDLYVGSSGTQVADLNRILGVGSGSYFDQNTKAAVIQFQNQYAAEVLSPAGYTYGTGQVGPLTRAKLNQICNGVSGSVLGTSAYNPYYTNYYGTNYNQYPYNYNNYNQYTGCTTYTTCPNNYNTGYGYPTLNFYSSATNINQNDSVTLTWNGSNISSCSATDGWYGSKSTSGSETRSVYSNTTFTLNCYGNNGQQVTRSVTIYTNGYNSGNNAPVTMSFYANPTSIFSGGTTALVWNVTNAYSCNASGDWSGTKSPTGALTVTPTYNNRTYTLTCSNYAGQSTSQTISVGVI